MEQINDNLKRELGILESKESLNTGDYEMIFSLYKHFIDANAPFYTTGCSCKNSIDRYYKDLMKWYKNYKIINEQNGGVGV